MQFFFNLNDEPMKNEIMNDGTLLLSFCISLYKRKIGNFIVDHFSKKIDSLLLCFLIFPVLIYFAKSKFLKNAWYLDQSCQFGRNKSFAFNKNFQGCEHTEDDFDFEGNSRVKLVFFNITHTFDPLIPSLVVTLTVTLNMTQNIVRRSNRFFQQNPFLWHQKKNPHYDLDYNFEYDQFFLIEPILTASK